MNEAQIRSSKAPARTQPRITLTAPISGVVAELMAREGMTVMPGAHAVPHQRPGHGLGEGRSARKPGGAAASRCEGAGAQPGSARHDVQRHGAGDRCRR